MSNASRSLFPNKRSLGIYGEPQKLDSDLRLDCVTVDAKQNYCKENLYYGVQKKIIS